MPSPIATLGDAALDGSAPVEWALTVGTSAFMTRIELDLREAEKLPTEPSALTVQAGGASLSISSVSVVGEVASQDKHRRSFLIADLRYLWNRKHVFRRYNIRTRSGERRKLSVDGENIEELDAVVADVTYKRFSLNNGTPWTAVDMVRDVLDEVVGAGKWRGDLGDFTQRHVDGVELDDSAPGALSRVMGYLVGAALFVDRMGMVRVFNALDRDAAGAVLDAAGFEKFGSQHPALVRLSRQRPGRVRVLMTPEAEVRFDRYGPSDTVTGDERFFENVTAVPDLTLEVDGKTQVVGTYVPTSKIIEAWNATLGAGTLPLTDESVRRDWVTNELQNRFIQYHTLNPSSVWARRVASLMSSYRQTFRISPRWMGAIHSFRPYRVALLDPETGTFAASRVHSDYAVIWGERGRQSIVGLGRTT